MKRMLISSASLLLVAASLAQAQTATPAPQSEPSKEYAGITNFLRVNQQICTGGQPSMADLEKMKAEGIRAIINLRQAGEYNAEEEATKAKELGLRYVHIPVNGREPRDEYAEQFLRALADPANRPAFIHCATANRVGALWMIRRAVCDGWSLENAEAEARKIGLRSPGLIDFARSYVERTNKLASAARPSCTQTE